MSFSGLFGSGKWNDRQEDLYRQIAGRDDRLADFKNYAGTALNGLAGRGVINSSVGAGALAAAAAQAQRNYDQMQMNLLKYASSQQDDPGIIGGLMNLGGTAIGSYFGGPDGAKIGGAIGSGIGGLISSAR